jgi:hypothetical protein
MRTVEGLGRIAPTSVAIHLESSEVRLLRDEARRRVAYRNYRGAGKTHWQNGAIGNAEEAVAVGMLGELAFAKWAERCLHLATSIDLAERPFGDGGLDYQVGRYRVQVKTAKADYDYVLVRESSLNCAEWDLLVRCHYTPRSRRRCDTGIFGTNFGDDLETVELRGWVRLDHYRRHHVREPGKRDPQGAIHWWNARLEANELQPMQDLADLYFAETGR